MKTCIRYYLCQISSTDLLVMIEKFSKILKSFKTLCPKFLIFLSNTFSNISILLQIRLYQQYRLKYLTRLHIGLSHLCESLSTVFSILPVQYAVVVMILHLLAITYSVTITFQMIEQLSWILYLTLI